MLRYKISIFILVFFIFTTSIAKAENVTKIIEKRDKNEYIKSAKIEAEMIIRNKNRKLTKKMIIYINKNDTLTEFTNSKDKGTKFLKKGDNLWLFFPDAEDIVKISGHALEQGIMGSDLSYKDVMESKKFTSLYDFRLLGEDTVRGRLCYLIEAIAKKDKKVSYYRRKIWIDKERYITLKEELYAQSKRLLKEIEVLEVKKIGDRWYPIDSIVRNKLRKKSSTEFRVLSIVFNPDLKDDLFSIKSLR